VANALLYDADCGFCTRSAHWAKPLGCAVEAVPWQSFDLPSVGLTPAVADEQVQLVLDGRVYAGHEAIGRTLTTSRHAPVRLAGRIVLARPLRPLAAGVYAWVARNRHRLPGGTAACAVPTDDQG
jgi:predicted DCC family thiol-disulfide oxidoreductase YuxK